MKKTTLRRIKSFDCPDADILDWLARQDNKQGYIKALIRADMAGPKSNDVNVLKIGQ